MESERVIALESQASNRTSFSNGFPSSTSGIFLRVVSAILRRASFVKKPWCDVMKTFGKVNNLASISS